MAPPTEDHLAALADVKTALVDRPERTGAALAQLAPDDMAVLTAATIHLNTGMAAEMATALSLYMTIACRWSMTGGPHDHDH